MPVIEGVATPLRPAPGRPQPGGLNVGALIARLLRNSPFIVAALVLGGVCGYQALQLVPPRYESSVSILIDPKRPDTYGSEGAFSNLYVDSAKISSVELVMTSDELLRRVVEAEGLADLPAYGGEPPSLLHDRLSFIFGARTPSPTTPEVRERRAIYNLGRSIRTQRIGMTYVIKVDVSARTSDLAYRLARSVADVYLNDLMNTKIDAAQRDAEWLADRLKQQQAQLIQSEDAVEAIRQQHGLTQTDSGPGSTVDRQSITDINAQLAQAEGDVAAKQSRREQVERLQRSGGSLQGLPEVAASPVITALRQQQAAATRLVADLSSRYTSAHPELASARADLKTVDASIAAEASRIADGIRTDADAAVAHRDALRRQLAQLVGKTGAASSAAGRVELKEAERVAEANRTVYDASLARLRGLEEQRTRQTLEARVISPAVESGSPASPKPAIFVGGGAIAGMLLACGVTFLRPMLERRVVNPAVAERSAALPVLAQIPYLNRKQLEVGGRRLTIIEYLAVKPLSRFNESLRAVRVALRLSNRDVGKVVAITSSVPHEGKSVTAAALAASAAAAGLRAVVVDLDFYKPSICEVFGLGASPGVVDVLVGDSAADTVLQPYATLPLRIIGAGSSLRPRPEMVETPQFRRFVELLRSTFDLVVLDTPPVLAASDAVLISGVADATIMVIAWRSTPSKQVDEAVSLLRAAGAPLLGTVLNKVKAKSFITYDGYGPGYPGYPEA